MPDLGPSITYDIVTQQHGGSIAVDSQEGDYSEFTIRLPRGPAMGEWPETTVRGEGSGPISEV